jgi:hypothetical protein
VKLSPQARQAARSGEGQFEKPHAEQSDYAAAFFLACSASSICIASAGMQAAASL